MNACSRTMVASIAMLGFASTVLAQSGGGYDLTWSTIDGGGGTSTGGGFELSGTIGQPDAGSASAPLTGGGFELVGGFWPGSGLSCSVFAPADFDQDCDVDQADYEAFEACASGPEVGLEVGCENRDLDGDSDVDQDDFAVFQRCISGEGVLADPGCAD